MADFYMVRPNSPGPFRRTVRRADGQPTKKVLVFKPGVPVEVTARAMDSIRSDIEKGALVPVTVDAKGRPHVIRDPKPEQKPAEEPEQKAETIDQPDAEAGHGD